MTTKIAEADVRARAYALWLARGRPDGNPEADWLAAEEQLLAERGTAAGSTEPPAQKTSRLLGGEGSARTSTPSGASAGTERTAEPAAAGSATQRSRKRRPSTSPGATETPH